MNKYQFISLANHMLYEALVNVADDLNQSVRKLSEPAHTASIVSKFPNLMNQRWEEVKFGGCFIHQSPLVEMHISEKDNTCEVGDLLCLCKKTVDGNIRYNATLFQIKKNKSGIGRVKPDNVKQRRLYTEWPKFSFVYSNGNSANNLYDIKPKNVTPGAQYMFINKAPYYSHYCRCCCGYGPIVFTHSIPASIMENNSENSFGLFLWDFIHWQNGRSISKQSDANDDEWSRFVWELIDRSKFNVYNINKKSPKWHICDLRSNGEFFAFMTDMAMGIFDDQPYYKWVEQTQSHAGERIIPETDNHIEETERPEVAEENPLGISILFIDLDGDVR